MIITGWNTNEKNIKIISIYNNVGMNIVRNNLIDLIDQSQREGEELILIGDWNARIEKEM